MYDRMGHNAFEGGMVALVVALAVSVQKIFSASSVISLVERLVAADVTTPTSRFRFTLCNGTYP
jgi:hypothetical protein